MICLGQFSSVFRGRARKAVIFCDGALGLPGQSLSAISAILGAFSGPWGSHMCLYARGAPWSVLVYRPNRGRILPQCCSDHVSWVLCPGSCFLFMQGDLPSQGNDPPPSLQDHRKNAPTPPLQWRAWGQSGKGPAQVT